MRSCRAKTCARYARQLRYRGYQTAAPIQQQQAPQRGYATEAQTQDGKPESCGDNLSIPTAKARFNEIGVQHVSDHVFSQLFTETPKPPPPDYIALSKDHLSRHDLLGKTSDTTPPVAFDLPDLQGKSLDEHFYKLGQDAAEPYLGLAKKYARASPPPKPRKWVKRSGWTKYMSDGTSEAVEAPDEDAITFDTEVMWKESSYPVMACAVSATAWYGWLSPWLLGESESDKHLIPLGDPAKSRVVVGHNVGYDRARVLEEYDLAQSRNNFVDTMSLHVAVNGMCTRQRPTWMKHRKARDLRDKIAGSSEGAELHTLLQSDSSEDIEEEHLWVGRSSVNSLRDVAQFHCGITIDKARREYFGELPREGILEKYDELLDYCAADVEITHRVYSKVFPAFLETCPHPVSFAALRHLSTEMLPVDKSWEAYLDNAEGTYHKLLEDVQQRLIALSEKALEIKEDPEKYQNDPWLRQLDWSGQEVKMVKGKKKNDPPRPAKRQKMPGMPTWYKDLFPVKDGPINLTVRTRVAPLLLRMSWDGYPLVWSDKHGWTFRVPIAEAGSYASKAVVQADMLEESEKSPLRADMSARYFKLPHKDGPAARCANPMAKGYLQHFEKGTLTSEYSYAKEALEMNASCSYWISARDRIRSQMVVYNKDLHPSSQGTTHHRQAAPKDANQGYILPQLIPMGTITRRSVENTWLTASNAKPNRVGSELKSMVKAPPGHVFVGADVDSQELWIASIMGDSQFKLHGGNALGFMTLEGEKAQGTDLHSRTAGILGISRNDAKVFNYGRIYGAGLNFAAHLLKQFNPSLSTSETTSIASKLYTETKGQKTSRKVIRSRPFWRGGTESLVFNALEDFAELDRPRTPALGAGITEALMKRFISKGEFLTSRVNWAIQSSGVDYLHLLIVSMDYLTRRFDISARLAITVHDEIRYLALERDKYRTAMALQVANVWTRAMFCEQVGIRDLPQACAYFSAVDIDHVLRKEVDMDCVTPSHKTPIPPGESLNIVELLGKGREARLDTAVVPQVAPTPERYAYVEREPVMAGMWREMDLGYLRAQVASDAELRDLVMDYKKPQATKEPTSSKEPATTKKPAVSKASGATAKSSTSRKKEPTFKPRKLKSMSIPKKHQPQGIYLPEAPWLQSRLHEPKVKGKWYPGGYGKEVGNGRAFGGV